MNNLITTHTQANTTWRLLSDVDTQRQTFLIGNDNDQDIFIVHGKDPETAPFGIRIPANSIYEAPYAMLGKIWVKATEGVAKITYAGSNAAEVYGFNPLDIAGINYIAWYSSRDTDSYILEDNEVTEVRNIVNPSEHMLTPDNPSFKATIETFNNQPVFRMTPQTVLQSSAFVSPLAQPHSVCIIYRFENPSAFAYSFDGLTSSYDSKIGTLDNSDNFAAFAGNNFFTGEYNKNYSIHYVEFNGASTNYYIDGELVQSGDSGSEGLDGIRLGSGNFDGQIMDVFVMDGINSEADRNALTDGMFNTVYKERFGVRNPAVMLDYTNQSSITHTGGDVTAVSDQSGYGHDLALTTAVGTVRTGDTTVNGNNAIDITNGRMASSSYGYTMTQPHTICTTYRYNSQAAFAYAVDGLGASDQSIIGTLDNADRFALFAGNNFFTNTYSDRICVHVAVFDGVSTDYYVNGNFVASGNAGSEPMTGVSIGNGNFDGTIVNTDVFYRRLTVDEINTYSDRAMSAYVDTTSQFLFIGDSIMLSLVSDPSIIKGKIDTEFSVDSAISTYAESGKRAEEYAQIIDTILDTALDLAKPTVVVGLGTNDVGQLYGEYATATPTERAQFIADYQTILDAILARRGWKACLAAIPYSTTIADMQPWNENVNFPTGFATAPLYYYTDGTPTVNAYELLFNNPSYLQVDGIHLTPTGVDAYQDLIVDTVCKQAITGTL